MSAPAFEIRYHVPKNQCYAGSRGGQSGGVHLHVAKAPTGVILSAQRGRGGKLVRHPGESLCGKRGWYERPVEDESDLRVRCAECVRLADRYGVEWPHRSVNEVEASDAPGGRIRDAQEAGDVSLAHPVAGGGVADAEHLGRVCCGPAVGVVPVEVTHHANGQERLEAHHHREGSYPPAPTIDIEREGR